MKFCYLDESGTARNPIMVMVGILVDVQRMKPTKEDWAFLLNELSKLLGKEIKEIHTKDFYPGNREWRRLNGSQRKELTKIILDWFERRKHHFCYSSVIKSKYQSEFDKESVANDIPTIWTFLALHNLLALQKHNQKYKGNKGDSLLIFDKHQDVEKLISLINEVPGWTDCYYGRERRQQPLNLIIDKPYVGDSKQVSLIQIADFFAYFIRRYAEIKENLIPPRFRDEEEIITNFVDKIMKRAIKSSYIYPKQNVDECSRLFIKYAPDSLTNYRVSKSK